MVPLGPEEETPEPHVPVGHETATRLMAKLDKAASGDWDSINTGERRIQFERMAEKNRRAWAWKIAGPIIGAASVGLALWLGDAVWSKTKLQVTADVARDVSVLKADVGALKGDVGTLKTDVGTLKTDMNTVKTDGGTNTKILHKLAKKMRLDDQ